MSVLVVVAFEFAPVHGFVADGGCGGHCVFGHGNSWYLSVIKLDNIPRKRYVFLRFFRLFLKQALYTTFAPNLQFSIYSLCIFLVHPFCCFQELLYICTTKVRKKWLKEKEGEPFYFSLGRTGLFVSFPCCI